MEALSKSNSLELPQAANSPLCSISGKGLVRNVGSRLNPISYLLCGVGQVIYPLWVCLVMGWIKWYPWHLLALSFCDSIKFSFITGIKYIVT